MTETTKNECIVAVVVTYNGSTYIGKCLSSLQTSSIPVRILVIDNHSSDNTIEIVRKDFPEVELMSLDENLGFGKANNIGIKYAFQWGAEFIFLLNQDAHVQVGAIEELLTQQKKHEDYVLVSPLQLNGNGTQLDMKFGKHLSQSVTIGQILSDAFLSRQMCNFYKIDFANAAAWMLSRKGVEVIGLFNPEFEHYGEDFEYLHRVKEKKFHIGLCTKAIVYHDRNQNLIEVNYNRQKTLMLEKAWIRYRLCRRSPGIAINLLSVLSRALFAGSSTSMENMIVKLRLLSFIVMSLRRIIKMRNAGYASPLAFFEMTPDFKRML